MKSKFLRSDLTDEPTAWTYANYVQAGKGTPAIMVHGLAASLHDWDALLPELAKQGYASYALDLLGHGKSPKPEQLDHYTSDSVFAHMYSWIDSLDLHAPAILIGHSLGGYLSLQYTLKYPERVRALVLVNPFYSQSQLPPMLRFFLAPPIVEYHPDRAHTLLALSDCGRCDQPAVWKQQRKVA